MARSNWCDDFRSSSARRDLTGRAMIRAESAGRMKHLIEDVFEIGTERLAGVSLWQVTKPKPALE
jgi:hypothetical protein